MSLVHRHCRVVASAVLALAALGVSPGVVFSQGTMGVEALALERRSAEVQRLGTERRRGVERAMAHAQMPDTMYASTPDRAPPPHAVPLEVKRPVAPAPLAAPSARSGHRIALFVSAGGASGYEGLVRLINRSAVGGEVRIEGFDDAGVGHGPVTVRLEAGEAVHFSATELERGSAEKGLAGALGSGEGDWRLEFTSALDFEVLGYVRTADGFLTAMHDVVPRGEGGHRVVRFDAGGQASRLRIVNPGAQAAAVRIEGRDDAGEASGGAVRVTVPAQGARTLGAAELESGEGEGLAGALGTGTGRWRLLVSADRPIEVMSLLSTPSGHLVNLSSVPDNAVPDEVGALTSYTVPLLPAASRFVAEGLQGFVRVINHSRDAGEVRIEGFDDAGAQFGPVTFELGAHEAVELSSAELERGSTEKGLSGGVGRGEGDWWLRLSTGVDVEVLAYVQAQDGFVSALHDVVPRVGGVHRVGVFNPASETSQASRLRVVNPGAQAAEVRIEGIDDGGASSGGAVTFTLGGKAVRTLGAGELESGEGEGLSGGLGDGAGRWRLLVSADAAIEVMSLLADPSGHLANLSSAPGAAASETAEEVFAARISEPVVQGKCVLCHTAGGVAGATRVHFERASDPEHEALNLKVFEDFIAEEDDGAQYLLNKVQGVAHGGGVQVAAGTEEFTALERFLGLLGEDVTADSLTPRTLFDTVAMAPARKTLRRAALIFAGRNPTEAEYAAVAGGDEDALRAAIRGLMTGPQFHEFLLRGANDRLLTDRNDGGIIDRVNFVEFVREKYRRRKAAHESGDEREYWRWYNRVQHGARRAPVELIAHVVENDLPYTEILTADYIMANPPTATAYGAPTHHFEDPMDFNEFKPSRIEAYYREGEEFEVEHDPVLGADRIINPGPLITDYPHAGILNTTMFLKRYPTTATNRNRARSRWTWYHFLGLDIEKSASRTTDPDALADTNNPTMLNPACTVCHRVLDPVAGAFQNYGDDGFYKDQWGGVDSLDNLYKETIGPLLPIRATSWRDRETLSWPVGLAAGVETLRVFLRNHIETDEYDIHIGVHLDRLQVTDTEGVVVASQEFEDLTPPVAPWGTCGEAGRNSSTRGEAYLFMWSGWLQCSISIDVEIPSDGAYNVEIVTWSDDRHGRDDVFAKLAVDVNPYREGDTWYRDMRVPGFGDVPAPDSDNSVQWLAKRIVSDKRFAEATVKFWWPAIMGSEVAEPPEDEEDADFEGLLLAANAQGAEIERLAGGFRDGFSGRRRHNLKDLLVEIVLSKWFRADTVEDTDAVRRVALRDAGARRLLTPEELARKTAAITGVQWARGLSLEPWDGQWPNALTGEYRLLYGGIDSDGITERARDITSVMAGVAKAHATQMSCPVIMRELYLLPDSERLLFSGVDTRVTPGSVSGANAIRGKLVELHEKLLGVRVTPHSPDVEAAYRLFVDVWKRKRGSRDTETDFRSLQCDWWRDLGFWDGILDDAVVEHENEDGSRWYGYDWDHVNEFMDGIDWSDDSFTAQTWMVVLAYLMMDYRYLYL